MSIFYEIEFAKYILPYLALTLGSSGERRGGVFMTVSVRLNHDDAMLFRKYAEMNGISMSELVRLCSCCVAGRFLHERYKSFSFRAHCVIMSCQFIKSRL